MNYDNYYKNGGMTKEESVSAIALRIGAKKEAVAKFVEKNNIDTNKLNSDLKSGQVYFLDVITAIVGKPNNKYEKEIVKKYGNKMAMGGKTQGYDDREDERLGMDYGKISGKDFDGSHDMREHSRRDDARFEERMARGGYVSKGELVWKKLTKSERMKFLHENFTPQITPRSQETLVGKDYNFLPKNVKIVMESKYANVEDYADGGETERKAEAIKTAVEIATMAYKNGVRAYDMDFEDFSERIFYISKISYPIVDLRLAYNALLNSGYKNGGQIDEDELHELARLVMKSIDYTVNISLDEFINDVSMTGYQRELCQYVLKMFDSHEFAKGGAIENQYEGRTAEDIWNNLTEHQRMHFLVDHRRSIIGNDPKEPYYENSNKNWNDLDFEVSQGFVGHLIGGQYAKGGMMADGGAIKGSNPSTGEKFGVVIGSFEKNDDGLTTLTIRSSYSARIKSYELTFDERGFLRSIGDFGHTIDGTYPDMKGGHLSVKNVNADNKKESIDALAKITSPSFAKKVYEYVHEEKMAKGGKTDDNKWEYTDKDEIEYVVVKDKSKKEIKFDGKDVISGVHDLLEKGGKLTEIGKYYSKNDVVSVFVNGKNILDKNTVSGVWIKKDAKPMAGGGFVVVSENDGYWYIMSKPTSKQVAEEFLSTLTIPRGEVGKVVSVEDAKNHKKVIGRKYLKMADGGDVSEMKIGQTTVRKGFNGWVGKTMVDNFKGYDWDITTIKNSRGDLTTTAQGGKSEDKGGYKMFTFMLYQDPSVRLQTSRPARVNEKVVSEQHAEALKVFKEKVGNTPDKEKMADGGAIGFDALAKKVAKNYEGDEVKKQYQDEYGKTYDKKEAEEVGKKVAGKVYGQQQAKKKMAKGGKVAKKSGSPANRSQSKMTLISRKASEIRKANEPWKDAFNRAKAIIG